MFNYALCGFDKDALDLLDQIKGSLIGVFTKNKNIGYPILGIHKDWDKFSSKIDKVFTILDDCSIKSDLEKIFSKKSYSLISNLSTISSKSKVSDNGCFIQNFVRIGPFCKINDFVKLNHYVNIGHDVTIDKYCTIAPSVFIGGNTHIGSKTYIGAGSVIRNNIQIGKNCIIGMGSVVTKNIEDNCVFYGNPAKFIKRVI